ncbi:pyrroline-5-carboxylate reductase isoform X2 [Phalaenopsis equestris]|uniref:pyrroline-5-carboxylate reductase isoform X2 n=1 Tax=Phalaenopsis equestris TaxID=78828 RepID=UPI0009E2D93B|nr:pyrroline-5-carboxylate reductase isoform X2 [Phalaenopsis equestris]
MALDVYKLGFVGAGNMAESIARGVVKSGLLSPTSIRTYHSRPNRQADFLSFGVEILESSGQVVADSDIVILSVKPQVAKKVLLELKPLFTDDKLLVSIAAGIKIKDLQEWSGHGRIIRVMPNTPSAVGEAASVMCMADMATKKDEERVASLFKAVGKVWTVDEKYFDAVTGLSGPAYVYIAIEALADGGVAAGLPRDLALALASQTVFGASAMVNNTGKHPAQLKDAVTSPAGTTIAGIYELEKAGFRSALMSAVIAATNRCRELS